MTPDHSKRTKLVKNIRISGYKCCIKKYKYLPSLLFFFFFISVLVSFDDNCFAFDVRILLFVVTKALFYLFLKKKLLKLLMKIFLFLPQLKYLFG